MQGSSDLGGGVSAAAVVIGVGSYPTRPLPGAVADAVAFRDLLVELGLVDAEHVSLHTEPVRPDGQRADSSTIKRALKKLYDDGCAVDRFYFFFAGHGLLAPVDAARAVRHTAIAPSDVSSLEDDSDRLIDVDDLFDRFSAAGPREQFFFIDACRDDVFADSPGNVPRIAWPVSPNPCAGPNQQGLVYAVSPGAKAEERGGAGVFTSYLLDGLRGSGQGLDWSYDDQTYVVTVQSVHAHVLACVRAMVQNLPFWKQRYMEPQLVVKQNRLSAMRVVADPPQAGLTVTIEPVEAEAYTNVGLALLGEPLLKPSWPPQRSGELVEVSRHRYKVMVAVDPMYGVPSVEPPTIDARVQSTVLVRLGPPVLAAPPKPGPGPAIVTEVRQQPAPTAYLHAVSLEPAATIEIDGTDPPYQHLRGGPELQANLQPGHYRVGFSVGDELFSTDTIELGRSDVVEVRPTPPVSPLVHDMLVGQASAEAFEVAEEIGPIQAGIVATMLPLVGISAFSPLPEIPHRLRGLLPPHDPANYQDRPLVVVLAADGDGWGSSVPQLLRETHCRAVDADGNAVEVALGPLNGPVHQVGRVVAGFHSAPAGSFTLRLTSRHFGEVRLAAASLPHRATVVTLAVRSDGLLDVTQNVLRFPGRTYDEPVPIIPYSRMLRELQVGKQLYASGELIERSNHANLMLLRDFLHAKWTDPVLGCMAYYAWWDAQEAGLPEALGVASSNLQITAHNLYHYFGGLLDAQIIAARELPALGEKLLPALVQTRNAPILARSAMELADLAVQLGHHQAPIIELARSLGPGAVWTLAWDVSSVDATAGVPARASAG